jgi:hypothetical protein
VSDDTAHANAVIDATDPGTVIDDSVQAAVDEPAAAG